jgi:two-component system alkaline phosphatase synthesis response regulator PhoP
MHAILLVNPSEDMSPLLEELARADFSLETCDLPEAAERLAQEDGFDALILNLEGISHHSEVEALLRSEPVGDRMATLAVLRGEELGRVDLPLRVDDFVVLPASGEELAARTRRVLSRRQGPTDANVIRCGDLLIDLGSYRVFVAGRPVELTYKEYELLRFLASHGDQVCTRETILNQVWGYDFYGGARTVDVHIRRLRSKIEARGHTFIETVRNVGYRFRAQ